MSHRLKQGWPNFARHMPMFSKTSTDAPYRWLFLVTMLFHVISALSGNILKCKWSIW